MYSNSSEPFRLFQIELEGDERLAEFIQKALHANKVNKPALERHGISTKGLFDMTPQEEKYAKFFSKTAILVKDMDDFTLKAFIEDRADIAFQARAELMAAKTEDAERTKNGKARRGFDVDDADITSDAINAIKNRQQKMSKKDKLKASLLKMGVDPTEVERIMSSRNVKDNSDKAELPISRPDRSAEAKATNPFAKKEVKPEPSEAFNPFPDKKPEPKNGGINWDEIIKEAQLKEAKSKPATNPFAKKKE